MSNCVLPCTAGEVAPKGSEGVLPPSQCRLFISPSVSLRSPAPPKAGGAQDAKSDGLAI
jgi:hypothetical protein